MPLMAPSHRSSHRVHATIVRGETSEKRWDAVAGEEPLQIRACGPGQAATEVAVTMRTPGSEEELAVGFLIAEGLLDTADSAAAEFEFADPALASQPHDEILLRLPRALDLEAVVERHFVATASCGICGRASMDELVARVLPLPKGPVVGRSTVLALPARMRDAQAVFEATGGLHAAALFTPSGELLELREDIGRHNAVDKLVGARALAGALPADDSLLLVSGRVSFEIVQKAAVARVPVLCAVSAPSDLAVSTAERLRMTLLGFLRGDGFNVYAGAERIDLAA
jgi:FdhD protein